MGGLSKTGLWNKFGATERKDGWWILPLAVFIGLNAFGIYSTWAAFQGNHYQFGPYLSPFYSPLIVVDWWRFSPAFLILWAPLGFRATCYYYRKAYYRSFFANPPACSVGKPMPNDYKGESAFPFILQNIHRYMLFPALALIGFLWHDVWKALWFDGHFGIGVGTLVMFTNTFLLSLYTFSCHSFRHLIGGRLNKFSCGVTQKVCHKAWEQVSCLNARHMLWAWMSLSSVGVTDLYIRLCSMGVLSDLRIF